MVQLSIIIPIYNVEKYINECLKSIYDQKVCDDDFEIIDESEYSFKNKVEKGKYTLYYDIDGDSVSYALTVIKNDFRYRAIFNDENLLKDSYSIEEFVNDSMSIYDEWSRI